MASQARKIPIPLASGVTLAATEYEAQGRYISTDKVRFVQGKPEKIGGWQQWNLSGDDLDRICRSILCWQDFNYNFWHAFGTSGRLWVFNQEKVKTNITPWETTGTISNPFSTTSGSAVVTVSHTAHGVVVGQYVNFSGATVVGGVTINGEYAVAAVIDANSYTIVHSAPAASTAGPGGGASVAFSYELEEGFVNLTLGGGWGIGTWGTGTWGTIRSSPTYAQFPRLWSLDTYGQYLLTMPSGGKLYQWALNPANRAEAVANAPYGNFMFVTSERMVVVLGANGALMDVAWCDDDDPTDWTPTALNTANLRRLQEGARLVAGARLAQQVNLIWTDTAVYLMQFLGTNEVYSTRVVGTNCGLIAPTAFITVDGAAFWMGPTAFYMYNGAVQKAPNMDDIADVFLDLSPTQRVKVQATYNSIFREVWWFYPSLNAEECDRYVILNLDDLRWTPGSMARTAWGGRTLTGITSLFATGLDGIIYEHETGKDADGAALDWHIESGYFDIDSGNEGVNVDGYIPDFKRQTGEISLTFVSRDYPEDDAAIDTVIKSIAERQSMVDVRHFGRQSKFRLSQEGVLGGDFRAGAQRLEVGTTGKRR
ncbi:hypothetical protein [Aestuariivirga sp.]|uniref:hypothetical protein n=1 Tax=Aestuariivirga sp. TaxID=2650926 RepID=UPI0039E2B289